MVLKIQLRSFYYNNNNKNNNFLINYSGSLFLKNWAIIPEIINTEGDKINKKSNCFCQELIFVLFIQATLYDLKRLINH